MSALAHLKAGEIVLLTTDTLPGLHTLASLPGAAARLRQRKGSDEARPYLLLFASIHEVLAVASPADPSAEVLLRAAWPGPVTALLQPKKGALEDWTDGGRTLAARVPDCEPLRALIAAVGGPLYSTSANCAGQPPAATLSEARVLFPDLQAYDLGESPLECASTIVDLSAAPPRVTRQGAAPWPPPTGAP